MGATDTMAVQGSQLVPVTNDAQHHIANSEQDSLRVIAQRGETLAKVIHRSLQIPGSIAGRVRRYPRCLGGKARSQGEVGVS